MMKSKEMENYILCLCSVFVFGLMAHAFRYFNTMYSHDSITRLYVGDFTSKVSLGRFAHAFYMPIRNLYAAPWLIGFISLFFISVTTFLVVRIFSIDNKLTIILLSGIFATNYSLTLINATYVYVADVYMLAILLFTLSVYLLKAFRYGFIGGSICIAVALGLYQSYITIVLLLVLFVVLFSAYRNEDLKKTGITILKTIIMLLGSYFIYSAVMKIFLAYFQVELSSGYNGINSVGDFKGYSIISLLKETYVYVIKFFLNRTSYNSSLLRLSTIIIGFLLILALIYCFVKLNISRINRVIIIVCCLSLPIAMNCVYIIAKGTVHHLMVYPFCYVYILLLLVTDFLKEENQIYRERFEKRIQLVIIVLVATVLFCNVVYANDIYLKKQLEYEDTQLLFNRIIAKMENLEGFQPTANTEIVIIGIPKGSPLYNKRVGFKELDDAIGLSSPISVTTYPKYEAYFKYVLNYPIHVADKNIMKQYCQKDEVKNMPAFPYEGSVKMVDDRVVVKISEEVE